MNEETALLIIENLAKYAQQSGTLTLQDAVDVKNMLDFVKEKLIVKEKIPPIKNKTKATPTRRVVVNNLK